MMDIEAGEGQIQIHLVSKQEIYAVPDTPIMVGAKLKTGELNTLVNAILQETGNFEHTIEFDFLINGEFVRSRLSDHLRERNISFEDHIYIEYLERYPPPEPQDCLLHDDWVAAVQTRDKYILTGCYDHSVNVWTTAGKHLLTLTGHEAPVKAVAWISLDSERAVFVSASQDQQAMVWQWNIAANTWRCVSVCKGHERGVDCVAVNPSGTMFATGSWDTMLKVWPSSGEADQTPEGGGKRARSSADVAAVRTPKLTLQGHREAVSGVQWMADDMLLTSSWDHTLKIWDLSLEGVRGEISGNKSFFDCSYSPLNGLIITASADRHLRLFDARTNNGTIVKNTYLGHTAWVQSVCWSKTEEHLFVSGSYDNQVKLWDMRSPKAPLYDLTGHEDKVHAVDWSNPKFMVSGGADNTVRVFKSRKAAEKIAAQKAE